MTASLRAAPIRPVILCGGGGLRLWPASRAGKPKPFLPLLAGQCSFDVALSIASLPGLGRPLIVASSATRSLVREHLAKAKMQADVILEDRPCNTGLAIALAVEAIGGGEPDTNMLVLPADHHMTRIESFAETIARGADAARLGLLCVFGVKPDRLETGYGYIRGGQELIDGVCRVSAFKEKPDSLTAAAMLRDGWLWNAGYFMGQVQVFRNAYRQHAPALLHKAQTLLASSTRSPDAGGTLTQLAGPDIPRGNLLPSFDVAVMEHVDFAAVVAMPSGWADIGSWEALWALSDKAADGCAHNGPVIARGARSSLLWSDGPRLVALGIDNLVVAVTSEAVLVAAREALVELKPVVEGLETEGADMLYQSRTAQVLLHHCAGGETLCLAGHSMRRHVLVLSGSAATDSAQLNAGDALNIEPHEGLLLTACETAGASFLESRIIVPPQA